MKVTAKATRSGDWWAIEVPEVPGAFTQVKRLDQVGEAAAAAVADLLEVDAVDVEVDLTPMLDADVLMVVKGARDAAAHALVVQAKASSSMRQAVSVLRESALLTTRDAAVLLGISHQRVAQLSDEREASVAVPIGRAAIPKIDVPRIDVPMITTGRKITDGRKPGKGNETLANRPAAAKGGRYITAAKKQSSPKG